MTKPLLLPVLFALLSLAAPRWLVAADPPVAPVPPEWIKPAFDRGLVTVEFYDQAKEPREYPGWTIFDSDLTYQFDYEFRFREDRQKKYVVTLLPKFSKVELAVRHRIQLPKHLDSPGVWEMWLAQHELEHVGVGAHRRTVMLAEHLVRKVKRVERSANMPNQITKAWVQDAIREEIAPRREALDQLIKANNRSLDKLTGHGSRSLGDRDAFYGQMYLKENLDEMKFPYLSEVLELLDDRDYLAARWESPARKNDKPGK
ncbi:MAG: hypothetical protein H7062_22915 [Candidatus Saccharimonas sp.]|nr:hypothetical protein [Planctomycetaceae bacterium]